MSKPTEIALTAEHSALDCAFVGSPIIQYARPRRSYETRSRQPHHHAAVVQLQHTFAAVPCPFTRWMKP